VNKRGVSTTLAVIVIIIIVVASGGAYFLITHMGAPVEEGAPPEGEEGEGGVGNQPSGALPELAENSHFGFVPTYGMGMGPLPPYEEQTYEVWSNTFQNTAVELGTSWIRPHPGPFSWHLVEPTQGTWDFDSTDACVKAAQEHNLLILATIWPYAEWDQDYWRGQPRWEESSGFEQDLPTSRYKPHDIVAYKRFVRTMVERYDGDGENDMPGLSYPVRYWEVLNEPETGGWSNLNFFNGTAQDYLEVLQATYEAVKEADPNAVILHGGATGGDMQFWENVLSAGGATYFDIGNIHSINGPEDLGTTEFSEMLGNYGKEDYWVTEIQIASGDDVSEEEQARLIVKGYVEAFGNGATKGFYTVYEVDEVSGSFEQAALIEAGREKPAYYAIKTLMEKLDQFGSVTKLSNGQYKFIVGDNLTYVLWGTGSVPSEITGAVTVTDISGNESQTSASEITPSDSPIFIEPVE